MTLPEIKKYILTDEETAALVAAVFSVLATLIEPDEEEDPIEKVKAANATAVLLNGLTKVKMLQRELKNGIKEFNEREENKNA